jgi:pimeloyl-ACP methyl ester carboxylesterase
VVKFHRLAPALVLVSLIACSSEVDPEEPAPTDQDVGKESFRTLTPAVTCSDTIASIYADPGALPAQKGAILRCAHERDITKEELAAGLPDYEGKPFTSGLTIYRVLYRTERGDGKNTPAVSSAAVLVPSVPRADELPVVVVSHGTRGQGGSCAASKLDELYQTGPLAALGYLVIAPDLAGFSHYGAADNPPSVYAGAEDVAKSTLDGAKALRNMFGPALSQQIVLVGHSQGGHTALSALALSASYDAGGEIAGVFAYAPLWMSQASWGALPYLGASYGFKDYPLLNASAIWYIYTHGEALDGPGHGVDAFREDKRAAIKSFQDEVCLDEAAGPLEDLGSNITDVYDPAFMSSVMSAAAFDTDCGDDAVCTKWMARFQADRPHLTGKATKVPIQFAYGGADEGIPPERMACVLDRLDADGANHHTCFEPDATHLTIVYKRSDFAADWIAARTLGGAEPTCQTSFERPACATPPNND